MNAPYFHPLVSIYDIFSETSFCASITSGEAVDRLDEYRHDDLNETFND